MGTLEREGRKRKRKRDLKYALLIAVQAAALAGVVLAAPNLPSALHKLGLFPSLPNDGSTIARARRTFLRKGLLTERGGHLRLTSKGSTALAILLIVDEMEGDTRLRKEFGLPARR